MQESLSNMDGKKGRRNTWNVMAVCLYVALKFLAAWQLDHLVAPTFWATVGTRMWEVLPWLFLPATWFYVVCFVGFFAFDPLWFIALWWWKE